MTMPQYSSATAVIHKSSLQLNSPTAQLLRHPKRPALPYCLHRARQSRPSTNQHHERSMASTLVANETRPEPSNVKHLQKLINRQTEQDRIRLQDLRQKVNQQIEDHQSDKVQAESPLPRYHDRVEYSIPIPNDDHVTPPVPTVTQDDVIPPMQSRRSTRLQYNL